MTILDQLIEKKDVLIYIRARCAEITRLKREEIVKLPIRDRERFRQRMIGRLQELKKLNEIVHGGQRHLKDKSLEIWGREWEEIYRERSHLSDAERKFVEGMKDEE